MIKWLTIGFAGLLLLIVASATFGWAEPAFAFIRQVPGSDKVAHFVLLGMMSLLLNLSLGCRRTKIYEWDRNSYLTGSLILVVLVTVEEISQIWIPTRSFSMMDLISNYLGIMLFGWWADVRMQRDEPKE